MPALAAGRVCPSYAGGLECIAFPPCSEAGPLVGDQGCHEAQGHSPDFKAFPRGLSCPPPCPALKQRGWQMLFHRLRRVGGLRKVLLGGSGGQWGVGSCLPARAGSSGLPGLSVPQAWGWGIGASELRLVPPAFSLPTAHQASWLWPPPIPGCVCRAPLGNAGEEAQRAQNSGCPRSQVFARAVRDRQACGEFGACGTGGSSRVGRQAGGGKLGLPTPPVEPCRDHRSPGPDQKAYPAASSFL